MKKTKYLPGVILIAIFSAAFAFAQETPSQLPDAPYFKTAPKVVEAMLKLANVTKDDVVYDLGCGDGRIVIAAAKKYGARGVGIEIDPKLIREANKNARRAGVADKVKFIKADLFETDFSKATVVTLYLMTHVNLKLRPILLRQLKPGTRIVSHTFAMGDWKPEQTIKINNSTLYFWAVPEKTAAFTAR
jgi:cyclopropane fatty-acyl-phospholipid synthase-like methyltransferase